MRILGIESTCDETGAAVVEDGVKIISNLVSSSLSFHKKYGGVVPEVAAREQVRSIIPVIYSAINDAARISNFQFPISNKFSNPDSTKWAKKHIDAVAVSFGPGLIGSLLIGVETAKALAFVLDKPLVGVNHLVGHIYSCWLDAKNFPEFPMVALVVSGGHTDLIYMKGHKNFQWLGGTRDDAAGEAFDKVSRILGLSYPGGPEIERVAGTSLQVTGNQKPTTRYHFSRPMINEDNFDFSFSGLKTQVINHTKNQILDNDSVPKFAFEFQEAVVDTLVKKTLRAATKFGAKSIVVGGGVAANQRLKGKMTKEANAKFEVYFPDKNNAVDNGAMIASAAFFNYRPIRPLELSADPSLHFV